MGKIYTNGTLNFSLYFNIDAAAPIDSRQVVASKSDLTTVSTWRKDENSAITAYKGMVVTVLATGTNEPITNRGLYQFIGDPTYSSVTNTDNWIKLTSTIEVSDLGGELTIKIDGESSTLSLKDKVVSGGSVKNIESVSESGTVAYYTQNGKAFKIDNKFIYKETVDNTYKYYIIYNTDDTDDKVYLTDLTESTLPSNVTEKSYIFLTIADGNNVPVVIPASSLIEYISIGNQTNKGVQLTLDDSTHLLTAELSSNISTKLDTAYNTASSAIQTVDVLAQSSSLLVTDTGASITHFLNNPEEGQNDTKVDVKMLVYEDNIADSYRNRTYTSEEITEAEEGDEAYGKNSNKYYTKDGFVTASKVKTYVEGQITSGITSALTWE